ncbi:MAG TPA: hypothetical protein PK020_03570 [Ilumatobacteraceae bacterium]|nr:hypothetical protein [Ilumatobacteraceae bacterium]
MSSESEQVRESAVLAPVLGDTAGLIAFAADVTETLRYDDGMYCFDRQWDAASNRGRSHRYTLMVALGFSRAAASGYSVPRTALALADVALAQCEEFTAGDKGLALWLLARLGDQRAVALVGELSAVSDESLRPLEGMEIAWLVIGAAAAVESGLEAGALLDRFLAVLRSRRAASTPLYHHLGTDARRAHLPNFATQIYSVLALADVGRITNDAVALADSRRLADLLVELRGPQAAWPWLFHAEKGTVVETYQVYSVHQDAMAPMAYFALAEATGDDAYARAGAEGLAWCFGANELGFQFHDSTRRFAHRAIKRGGWADRAELWLNTAAGISGIERRVRLGEAVVNTTCRPYHLGWILEAWAGREVHARHVGGPK